METKKRRPLLINLARPKDLDSTFSSTQSTATIVQKPFIPEFVNNKNLRNKLNRTFDTRGEKQLEKILIFKRKLNLNKSRIKKRAVSINVKNPNDMIMQEFFSIKSKRVWSKVLNNFKNQPTALFKLIDNDASPKKTRKSLSMTLQDWTNSIKNNDEHQESDEDDVITFKSDDIVPEDWKKSLICWKVKKGVYRCTTYAEDIQKSLNSMPRTQEGLEKGIQKGLKIIENFLLEMLGTKEDMQVFSTSLSVISLAAYESLYNKCLSLSLMRIKAIKILKLIQTRESLLLLLSQQKPPSIDLASQICKINQILKPTLIDWECDESIPFKHFIYNNHNYLNKIEQDNLIIQQSLFC